LADGLSALFAYENFRSPKDDVEALEEQHATRRVAAVARSAG
jgi:hypothetical protein